MTGVSKPTRRLGFVGYADVLNCIRREPRISTDVCERLGWNERRMNMNLRLWCRLGLLHVIDWKSAGYGRTRQEVWGFGPGENAPRPSELSRQLIKPHAMRGHAFAFSVIVRELRDGATTDDVKDASGITRRIVADLLRAMHVIGLVYVHEWIRQVSGGEPVPVYRLNSRPNRTKDAPRLKRLGNAAAARKWRANKQARALREVSQAIGLASLSPMR